jgi:hypothetical protein
LSVFRISTALSSVELTLDEAAATAAAVAGLVVIADTNVDVPTGLVGPVLGGTDDATLVATLGAIFGAMTDSGGATATPGFVLVLGSLSSNFTKLSSSLSEICSDDNSSLLSATVAELVARGELRRWLPLSKDRGLGGVDTVVLGAIIEKRRKNKRVSLLTR